MFSVQKRIYCSDCKESYIDAIFTNHSMSQGHYINVRKKHCTISKTNSLLEEIDPYIPVDKLRAIHEKKFKSKVDCAEVKKIIDEQLRKMQQLENNIINFELHSVCTIYNPPQGLLLVLITYSRLSPNRLEDFLVLCCKYIS